MTRTHPYHTTSTGPESYDPDRYAPNPTSTTRPDKRSTSPSHPDLVQHRTLTQTGARAQLHLRQILVDLDMHPINRPQLLISNAHEKFDSNLRLADGRIRQTLRSTVCTRHVDNSSSNRLGRDFRGPDSQQELASILP